jgi:hypothetical protein
LAVPLLDPAADEGLPVLEIGVEGAWVDVVVGVGDAACVALEVCAELCFDPVRRPATLVRRCRTACRTRRLG